MKNLKTTMLTLGLSSFLALGACGDDLSKMKDLVDEMCACKDKACLDKLEAKAKKAMSKEAMEKLAKEKPEEVAKLTSKAMACAMKMETAGESEAE